MLFRTALPLIVLAACTIDREPQPVATSTQAASVDTDGDSLADDVESAGWEISIESRVVIVASDPNDRDTDDDGLDDGAEYDGWALSVLGVERLVRSNPKAVDSDDDGVSDAVEREEQSDPARAHSFSPSYEDSSRLYYRKAVDAPRNIPRPAIELGQAEPVVVTGLVHRVADTGVVLPYEVHFLQPDAGETVTVEVESLNARGGVVSTNVIRNVVVTEHPGGVERVHRFDDGAGRVVAKLATATAGMYGLTFAHDVRSTAAATLRARIRDGAGNAIPIVWERPPVVGKGLEVELELSVPKGGAYANWGGGAYSRTAGHSVRVGEVRFDGMLVYGPTFADGPFSFDLGWLPPGAHTLTASYSYSSGAMSATTWEGFQSGPSLQVYKWDDVTLVHTEHMKTVDYDAWEGGVAYAEQSRPAPIRRGTTMTVHVANKQLGTANATLAIYKKGSNIALAGWTKSKQTEMSLYKNVLGNFDTTVREVWTVSVPATVAVGAYELEAKVGSTIIAPSAGHTRHPFYVLFNPTQVTGTDLTVYTYDETTVGTAAGRDDWAAFYRQDDGSDVQVPFRLYAFRRAAANDRSMLSLAMAIVDGQTTELGAARRLHRVVGQRVDWQGPYFYDGAEVFNGSPFLSNTLAASWAEQNTAALDGERISGECSTTAIGLTALARAIGLPARPVSAIDVGAFHGYHVWTEIRIPQLPIQGGKTSATGTVNADADPWVVFDALIAPLGFNQWHLDMPAVAPAAQYARVNVRTADNWGTVLPRTNPANWNTSVEGTPPAGTEALSMGPRYAWDGFWIPPGTSVAGILNGGEKDIFSVRVVAGAPRTFTVTGDPFLTLRVMAHSLSTPAPVAPPAVGGTNTVTLSGAGDYELIIYAEEALDCWDGPCLAVRGNSVQYTVQSQ